MQNEKSTLGIRSVLVRRRATDCLRSEKREARRCRYWWRESVDFILFFFIRFLFCFVFLVFFSCSFDSLFDLGPKSEVRKEAAASVTRRLQKLVSGTNWCVD